MIPEFSIQKIKTSISSRRNLTRARVLSRSLNPRASSLIGENRLAKYRFLTIQDWMTYDTGLGVNISKSWKELFILQPPEEQLRQATELVSGGFNPPNYWEDYREENAKYGTTIKAYMDWFYNEEILEKILNLGAINWWGVYSDYQFIIPMKTVEEVENYGGNRFLYDTPYITFVSYVE